MTRNRRVTLTIRTATLKCKTKRLETVSIMKTRVNSSTNVTSMMSQVAEQLFIGEKNHLVLDLCYGMKESNVDGKICFIKPQRGPGDGDDIDDDCDPAAWPEGLPTYSIESVLHEAIRISNTVRHA